MRLLQRMGWQPGKGLGKQEDGQLEPLLLDVKADRRGNHKPMLTCLMTALGLQSAEERKKMRSDIGLDVNGNFGIIATC